MSLVLTDEQRELRRTVRLFLEDRSPEHEVRRLMATEAGHDPDVWREMGTMLGLQGLAVPEHLGGSGFTALDSAVVFEELGRSLLCAPYFSSVALAANAFLFSCDDEMQRAHLPKLASGDSIGTFALTEDSGRWDQDGVTLQAVPDGPWYRLHGHKMYVTDGLIADIVVVVGRTQEGVTVFVAHGDAPGLTRRALPTMDQTRKLARIEFEGVPAQPLGVPGEAWPVVERILAHAVVALAAEQVGGAQRCLDMAVDYAKTRVQFGRPIGSFQAIKHKCADMLLRVESARSAARYAARCAADSDDDLQVAAHLAKSYCSEAYTHISAENIQIHGGIGFTWEHPAHLYFKRAKSSELLLGDPAYHRRQLAGLVRV